MNGEYRVFDRDQLGLAINLSTTNNNTTYVVLFTLNKEVSFNIQKNNDKCQVVTLEKSSTPIVECNTLKEVHKAIYQLVDMSNECTGYDIINANGIEGLFQFLLENRNGRSNLFKKNATMKKTEAIASIGLAAAVLDRDISVCGLTFIPNRDNDFDCCCKIKWDNGVVDTEYVHDIFDHVNEHIFG